MEVQLGAVRDGLVQVRQQAALGEQEPTVRLEHEARAGVEGPIGREAAPQLGGIQHFVRQVVQLRGCQRAAEGRPILGTALDAAGGDQQLLAGQASSSCHSS